MAIVHDGPDGGPAPILYFWEYPTVAFQRYSHHSAKHVISGLPPGNVTATLAGSRG